jgi:hypothetical protein
MKRKLLPLVLTTVLVAAPAPAVATNGTGEMARFMWMMMEMFAWMMGGNRSFNNVPYGGYGGLPTGLGSLPGGMGGLNPYSMAGLGALTGTGMPYNYSALSGLPGASGLGTLPYGAASGWPANTYPPGLYNSYGQPVYGYTPYRTYLPPRRYRNDKNKNKEKPAQVVVQPVIIQPPAQSSQPVIVQPPGQATGNSSVYPEPLAEQSSSPIISAPPPVRIDIPTGSGQDARVDDNYAYPYDPYSYGSNGQGSTSQDWQPTPYRQGDTPTQESLQGEWLGINGEYLVFEADSFRMIDRDKLTVGSYELKNGIMKARLANQEKPTYMQYHIRDNYLVFRTEDDQRMMFRRMGQ